MVAHDESNGVKRMTFGRGLTIVAVTIAVAATCGTVGAGSAVSKSGRTPLCTRQALIAAVRDGSDDVRPKIDVYGCAQSYAYAGVIVGSRGQRDEVTILFRATNGRWKIVSRAACEKHLVPRSIYQGACESN